jgi:drug/metabolite transporter (DMT)-like permease
MILFAADWTIVVFWVVLAFAAIPILIWPAHIAHLRHHPQKHAILVLSLLLGWTFFGWAIAMVWAFTNPPKQS